MFSWSKKKSTDSANGGASANGNDKALALQDPRTKVKIMTAATETTNTAVQNSTTFNSNKNTVTQSSTRETVTHRQQACVTEISSRRTANEQEVMELLRQMNSGGLGTTWTTSNGAGSGKVWSGSNFNGVSPNSIPTFKPSTKPNRSSTIGKLEHTSVSQKQGRTVTQHEETNRVPVKPNTTSWSYTPTSSASSSSSNLNKSTEPKSFETAYKSPYAKTGTSAGASYSTKPVLSSPKLTVVQPYSSLNPVTGAVPKLLPSTVNYNDAQGQLKPTAALRPPPISKPVSSVKLKPAEVIIFNHEDFDQHTHRDGSAEDVKKLEKTFKHFRCNVKTIKNGTLSKVKSTVNELEKKNFGNASALVVVILSHGDRHERIAAKNGLYNVDDDVLFPLLRNRTLSDKPKILFVQACKGSYLPGSVKTDAVQPHGTPVEVLKCYSTFEGYLAFRHDNGSYFIQTLCDTLLAKPNEDIESIMNQVRVLVKTYSENVQVPSVTSTMTKKYSFGDYM